MRCICTVHDLHSMCYSRKPQAKLWNCTVLPLSWCATCLPCKMLRLVMDDTQLLLHTFLDNMCYSQKPRVKLRNGAAQLISNALHVSLAILRLVMTHNYVGAEMHCCTLFASWIWGGGWLQSSCLSLAEFPHGIYPVVHWLTCIDNRIPLDFHACKWKDLKFPALYNPSQEPSYYTYLGIPMQNAAHVACILHAQSRRTELLPTYVCDVGNGCLGFAYTYYMCVCTTM